MKRQNSWIKRKRVDLVKQFGGKCVLCGDVGHLEFAHTDKTPISGQSKGRSEGQVYYDIVKHPHSYALLCTTCHMTVDLADDDKHRALIRVVRTRQETAFNQAVGDLLAKGW